MMREFSNLAIAIVPVSASLRCAKLADLRFTTLPQTGANYCNSQAGIPDASSVTRIVLDSSGISIVFSAKA